MTITNNGDTEIDGWTLTWAYTDGTVITNGWSSELSGEGSGPYTASNYDWNRIIQPGQNITFGFQGTHLGSTESVTLSGDVCN